MTDDRSAQVPTRDQLERNLLLYPWYCALAFTPFMVPVIVLFWQANGLDYFEIYALQGIFCVAIVVLEVPTGMIADRLGKRTSLLIGISLWALSFVVYGLGYGFAVFLAAELIMALAASLVSGADSGLLYDTLDALGREAEYTAIEGKSQAIRMLSFAVTSVIGGFIGVWSLRATMWASGIGPVLACFIVIKLTQVQPRARDTSFREAYAGYRKLIMDTARFVRKHALVRWYVLFIGVLVGSSGWVLWLAQPYMEFCGLPIWAFGAMFAIYNLWAAFASSQADRIEKRFGRKGTLLLMMALAVATPAWMAALRHPAAPLVLLLRNTTRGLWRPILGGRILQYAYADKRSTILSMASMAQRLFFGLTALGVGYLANMHTLPMALTGQSLALVVLFGGLWALYLRVPTKYFQPKAPKEA